VLGNGTSSSVVPTHIWIGTWRSDGSIGVVLLSGPPDGLSGVVATPRPGGPTVGWARANRSGYCVANL
jgi:hypothetical protein